MAALREDAAIELAEGGDGRIVDVVDEARLEVEERIVRLVDTPEVLRKEGTLVRGLS